MTNAARFYVLFKRTSLLSLSAFLALSLGACKDPRYPQIERCIIGEKVCICNDPRLPEGRQDYDKPLSGCVNYIATNSDDYFAGQEWVERNCKGPPNGMVQPQDSVVLEE